jgi:amidase
MRTPRRNNLKLAALTALPLLLALGACDQKPKQQAAVPAAPFSVVGAGIPEMQAAMAAGRITSRGIVLQYLARIAIYNDKLHGAVNIDPNVLAIADALDKERAEGKVRGPLHGIPVAVKDNILTTTMPSSGGALAFKGYIPPYDATLVENLRAAGAIVMAKSTLTELANWMAAPPTPMEGGYNAVRGYSYNPYDPRAKANGEPYLSTGGSSSGTGVASEFWAANVGTDTGGSVVNPANLTMQVGLRPTTGRISRWGIIPITMDQDSAGPMGKTVTDVAIMMGALEGAAPDSHDPATATCAPPPNRDYTQYLKADALKGARIGIPRTSYYDPSTLPGTAGPSRGLRPDEAQSMKDAIEALKAQGATIVDPADLPSVTSTDPQKNILVRQICGAPAFISGEEGVCSTVLRYGMKREFNAFLKTLGDSAPVKTLTELRLWNKEHEADGAIRYGQKQLDLADGIDLEKDKARYEADRARDLLLSRDEGMDAPIKANTLDVLMFPGSSATDIGTKAGYPAIAVPFGMVSNPDGPAGDPPDAKTRPFGVSFLGLACTEPRLFAIAYAFEQATKKRVPPKATP